MSTEMRGLLYRQRHLVARFSLTKTGGRRKMVITRANAAR